MDQISASIFYRMSKLFSQTLVNSFKVLLETKHLYQNINLEFADFDTALNLAMDIFSGTSKTQAVEICRKVYDVRNDIEWSIINPFDRKIGFFTENNSNVDIQVSIRFAPTTIKNYCQNCEAVQPYNFLYGHDILDEYKQPGESLTSQVFSLTYQCQSCKKLPEIFVVRREKLKIYLCGRTPMEKVFVANFIPKEQRKFFSDALIAYNSGQVLAANFLMRTFIEQYVRKNSSRPDSSQIDTIFEEYSSNLSKDFKERFPSLKNIYDSLSEDIHRAVGSDVLFQDAKKDIEGHFKAKELFDQYRKD